MSKLQIIDLTTKKIQIWPMQLDGTRFVRVEFAHYAETHKLTHLKLLAFLKKHGAEGQLK